MGAFGHKKRAAATMAALVILSLAGCRREPTPPKSEVAARALAPSGHLIVLPDSAIAVPEGSPEEQLAEFLASPAPAPRTFRFGGVEFDSWASKPNPPTLRTMYVMTQILRAYPKSKVTLVGYTDNDGTPAQNLVLARQRVDRLAEILVHGGIRAGRIETIGRGAVDFVGDNATPEGRARNRRIEVIVTAK